MLDPKNIHFMLRCIEIIICMSLIEYKHIATVEHTLDDQLSFAHGRKNNIM